MAMFGEIVSSLRATGAFRVFRGGARFVATGTYDVVPEEVLSKREEDMPIQLSENPYEKPRSQCILCKHKIQVNYKNTRLLSQFVSRYTGKVYGRHVSGLCEMQQKIVEREIRKARAGGLMPYYFKEPKFADDPELFDPERPFRSHPY